MSTRKKVGGWAVMVLVAATIVAFHFEQWTTQFNFAIVFYVGVAAMTLWILGSSARRRTFTHLPVAKGKVVAIVPAYEEPHDLLRACLESLLNQTRPLDAIIVVDDGSVEHPVVPFAHPLITWLRQDNAGKRRAQINGLQGHEDADFIVTVDSDSVIYPDGIEHLLRAMSNPNVQGTTGDCLVSNWKQNVLTKITDLEITVGNLVMRRARSSVGAVAPTSGPLSMYRAGVIFDNAEQYLTDGTYSDDRRLTHFSLLRGEVVSVGESLVDTKMPHKVGDIFKQRVRWYKGNIKYMGWEFRNMRGWVLALRSWGLLITALYPFVVGYVFIVHPLTGGRIYWELIAYWALLMYGTTFHYVMDRPSLNLRARLSTWLWGTPALIFFQMLILRPAFYYAITQVKNDGWATRGGAKVRRGRYRGQRVKMWDDLPNATLHDLVPTSASNSR